MTVPWQDLSGLHPWVIGILVSRLQSALTFFGRYLSYADTVDVAMFLTLIVITPCLALIECSLFPPLSFC